MFRQKLTLSELNIWQRDSRKLSQNRNLQGSWLRWILAIAGQGFSNGRNIVDMCNLPTRGEVLNILSSPRVDRGKSKNLDALIAANLLRSDGDGDLRFACQPIARELTMISGATIERVGFVIKGK